jgi:hypothetical protein
MERTNELTNIDQTLDAVIANYGIYYQRRLRKAIQTQEDLENFIAFYNLKKQNCAGRLIAKSFLLYKENIPAIVALENWLFDNLICDAQHTYVMANLNRLAETMITDEDRSLFIDVCEAQPTKGNCFLVSVFNQYLRAKGEPVFKNIDEIERIMFGKNYDEVISSRTKAALI